MTSCYSYQLIILFHKLQIRTVRQDNLSASRASTSFITLSSNLTLIFCPSPLIFVPVSNSDLASVSNLSQNHQPDAAIIPTN